MPLAASWMLPGMGLDILDDSTPFVVDSGIRHLAEVHADPDVVGQGLRLNAVLQRSHPMQDTFALAPCCFCLAGRPSVSLAIGYESLGGEIGIFHLVGGTGYVFGYFLCQLVEPGLFFQQVCREIL